MAERNSTHNRRMERKNVDFIAIIAVAPVAMFEFPQI